MKLPAFIFEQPSYLNGVYMYHVDLIGMTYGGTERSGAMCQGKPEQNYR